jgi:hypothetical protein
LSLMEYVKYNFGYIILRMELEERDALKWIQNLKQRGKEIVDLQKNYFTCKFFMTSLWSL